MTRAVVILFVALILGVFGSALLQAADKESADLAMQAWKVPPGFVSKSDPSNKAGIRQPLEGFKAKSGAYTVQYDAKEFLKAQGITFPSGSDAIYDESSNSLIVRNTSENLELIDAVAGGCGFGFPANLVVEIATYECILPGQKNQLATSWPTYSELAGLPAADIEILDRISANTKSGNRITMRNIQKSASVRSAEESKADAEGSTGPFLEGESGTIAEMDAVVGPDSISVDSNLTCRFRLAKPDGDLSEISFTTNFSSWENYPVVIFVSPSPRNKDKFLVVTGNVRVINFGGWAFEELKALREEKMAEAGTLSSTPSPK